MYHSVNISYVLICMNGESEYFKLVEKALRSEEVTILSKFVFLSGNKTIGGFQWIRRPVQGVIFYLARRIASLMELVVNTLINFGYK